MTSSSFDGRSPFIRNIEELRQLVKQGVLTESHWLDFKGELESGPKHNKELARDLASFSIDGGTVIFGVAEDAGALDVRGLSVLGLPERIEQVARMTIHPPLRVMTRVLLLDEDDATQGCLVVEVPPSPSAPHQVDDRYWGRNDKTKYPLPDDEVERVMRQRRLDRLDGFELLDKTMADDPLSGTELDQEGRLFVIAQPEWSSPTALLALLNEYDVRTVMNAELLCPIDSEPRPFGAQFAPDFNGLVSHSRGRVSGVALHSGGIGGGRLPSENAKEFDLLDVEVREDAGIVLFCSRATDGGKIMDKIVVGLTQRVVDLAAQAGRVARYEGSWVLGVGVTGLKGLSSYEWDRRDQYGRPGPIYSRDEYKEIARARTSELREAVEGITDQLLGRLLRSLGSYTLFKHELGNDV